MRAHKPSAWIVYIVCAVAPSMAAAQQADSLLPPNLTPISIDEPRRFPPAGTIEARPVATASPQPRTSQRSQPPLNVRLVAAEEPVKPQSSRQPLRLAPRSEAARQGVARPAAPTPTHALGTVAGSLG